MHAIKDRRCSKLLLAAAVIAWAGWGAGAPSAFAQAAHPPVSQGTETPRGNAAAGEQGGRPRAQNDNSPRLPADSVTEHSVELPGRADASQTADVRPQVSGIIKSINFKPGQEVKARVMEINREARRISLSLKRAVEPVAVPGAPAVAAAPAAVPAKKKKRPELRGGLDWNW